MPCCGKGGSPLVTIARGVVGLAKAAVRIGQAPSWIVGLRGPICRGCPERRGAFCSVCKCLLHAKINLSAEKCPLGKW